MLQNLNLHETKADEAALKDPKLIDAHFRLPCDNLYSLTIRPEDGRSKLHDKPENEIKDKDRYLKWCMGFLGNYIAYREIKARFKNSFIWDERYRFSGKPSNEEMQIAQNVFAEKFGDANMRRVAAAAREIGLDPGGKTSGRPDLAVYLPDTQQWHFVELKRISTNDKLSAVQVKWIELLNKHLGSDTSLAIEINC